MTRDSDCDCGLTFGCIKCQLNYIPKKGGFPIIITPEQKEAHKAYRASLKGTIPTAP